MHVVELRRRPVADDEQDVADLEIDRCRRLQFESERQVSEWLALENRNRRGPTKRAAGDSRLLEHEGGSRHLPAAIAVKIEVNETARFGNRRTNGDASLPLRGGWSGLHLDGSGIEQDEPFGRHDDVSRNTIGAHVINVAGPLERFDGTTAGAS